MTTYRRKKIWIYVIGVQIALNGLLLIIKKHILNYPIMKNVMTAEERKNQDNVENSIAFLII